MASYEVKCLRSEYPRDPLPGGIRVSYWPGLLLGGVRAGCSYPDPVRADPVPRTHIYIDGIDTAMPDVEITSDESGDAPEVIDTSDTVIVTPPAQSDDTATLVGMATVLGAVVERLDQIQAAVTQAQITAESAETHASIAEDTAEVAVDAAVTAAAMAEDEPETETVAEEPPKKTHWADRGWSEWRARRKS